LLRKPVSIIILSLLVVNALALAFNVQPIKSDYAWTETIYIRADGSIYPPDAPISTFDNVTYTLTGNIISDAGGIVVQKSNIVIDGDGYTLQGNGSISYDYSGIDLSLRTNITIKNTQIKAYHNGIWLDSSSGNTVNSNNIAANSIDIYLFSSSGNVLSGNNITTNNIGIYLDVSSGNTLSGNNVANSWYGIFLRSSSNNKLYHNNFIGNTNQIGYYQSSNTWDDGYPSGGNYWSDYNGTDSNHDGIGDTPYIIDANNTDHYPLMTPYIIPEFPSSLILALFMMATLLAVTFYKRKIKTSDVM
jgi:parallel beta-helix repeat protein